MPPSIQILPPNGQSTARKGGTVTFECRASGNPPPVVQWSKKVKILTPSPLTRSYTKTVAGGTITIRYTNSNRLPTYHQRHPATTCRLLSMHRLEWHRTTGNGRSWTSRSLWANIETHLTNSKQTFLSRSTRSGCFKVMGEFRWGFGGETGLRCTCRSTSRGNQLKFPILKLIIALTFHFPDRRITGMSFCVITYV